ncbi:HAAS signaling domain-containing protein [Gorillibacterium sp. sgz500922]|uniref:HAAS signaling domain-containing protein n=1 Tax=Gorillibacterium sp. sgz500922 TaxID=3446694 RepID=UPI003F6642AB
MDNLIERYVYEVIRQLPEKEREDVSRELKSNIYDMLSDEADEQEVAAVLSKLGSPAALAEKYRQTPRYLMSPPVYETYVRALKSILPLVGGLGLVIGTALGAMDAIQDTAVDWASLASHAVSKGITAAFAAAFQALVWTTIGFVIAERAGGRSKGNKKSEWSIEELPKALPDEKGRIAWSDSVTQLALIAVFSALAILVCTGSIPLVFLLRSGDTQITTLFSSSFLHSCIPAILIMAAFGILASLSKMIQRKWTPLVCGAVIVSKLINMGILIYLVHRSDLFSSEFTAYLQNVDWGDGSSASFMGMEGTTAVIALFTAAIVVSAFLGCAKAIKRTWSGSHQLHV